MSPQAIALAAAGGFVLLLAVAVLLLLPGGNQAKLRARARAATGVVEKLKAEPKQSIRAAVANEPGRWGRLAAALGYNPNLPAAYAASPALVTGSSLVLGFVLHWQTKSAFGELVGAGLGVAVALAFARFQFRRKTRLYTQLLFTQLPDALSLVVRSIRAGLPVGEALRGVAAEMPSPTRDEFGRMMGEVSLGVQLDVAIWNMYVRTQVREHSFLAVTLGLNAQTGGNLAETLENLSDMVRRRVAMVGKARAISAEARTSSSILAGMPFATAGLLAVVNPGYVGELFTDPRGKNFLIAIAILLSMGMLTIRWLLQRSTQD